MKTFWFCFKASIRFIYLLFTPLLNHKYNLRFIKEDGLWYIDLPDWPFNHGNLLMVAGADDLCEELSNNTNEVSVRVITSNFRQNSKIDYIRFDKVWSYLKYGGQYQIGNPLNSNIDSIWLCQVTLFVIGWWPKYLYIKSI